MKDAKTVHLYNLETAIRDGIDKRERKLTEKKIFALSRP